MKLIIAVKHESAFAFLAFINSNFVDNEFSLRTIGTIKEYKRIRVSMHLRDLDDIIVNKIFTYSLWSIRCYKKISKQICIYRLLSRNDKGPVFILI